MGGRKKERKGVVYSVRLLEVEDDFLKKLEFRHCEVESFDDGVLIHGLVVDGYFKIFNLESDCV